MFVYQCNFGYAIMSAYVSVGMMPNPVWPPTGIPMPGTAVQPAVPVAKPATTQSLPASSECECCCYFNFICYCFVTVGQVIQAVPK